MRSRLEGEAGTPSLRPSFETVAAGPPQDEVGAWLQLAKLSGADCPGSANKIMKEKTFMSSFRILFATLLAGLALLGVTARADTVSDIKAAKKIRIAIDLTNSPYGRT